VARRRRRTGRALGLILAAVVLAGCGYSTKGSLPDHIKTVAVPIFKNRTLEPGVDSAITSGVVNAFSSGGRVKVVADRLRLVLNVELRDVKRSAMHWRQEGLSETSDFQVQGQVSGTISVNLALDRF